MEPLLSLAAKASVQDREAGLSVAFNSATTEVVFALVVDGATTPKAFAAKAKESTVGGGRTREFALDHGVAKAAFGGSGLLGATFTGAEFGSARVVSRELGQGGAWTTDAPCFEVHLCWLLTVGGEKKVTMPDGTSVEAGAAVQAEVCLGLGVIRPDWAGLSNVVVRVDAPGLGLSTGWVPLALLVEVSLPELRLDPLVAWFAALTGVDLPAFGWPDLVLPDWTLDVPARLELPLGIGVASTRLWLRKDGQNLVIDAEAKDFFLTWNGETAAELGGRLAITYSNGTYTVVADLVRRQWPPPGAAPGAPFEFALPFDALAVSAKAWALALGVQIDDPANGGRLCFRAVLEIGGLEIKAAGRSLYKTDLRLLVLDRSVMTNRVTDQTRRLFAGVEGDAFALWRDGEARPLPAESFAEDLLSDEPDSPANDYGLTFLDGVFESGERVYLLWRMAGERLVKALAHDLLGQAPSGAMGADEGTTLYALEWLRDGDGGWQVRLDWRCEVAPSGFADASALAVTKKGACVVPETGKVAVFLPMDGVPVATAGRFDRPLTLSLPGVTLEAARPQDQALIFGLPADGAWSVSHLLLYPAAPVITPPPTVPLLAPVLRARVGFAVGGAEGKSVVETVNGKKDPANSGEVVEDPAGSDGTFLTIAAGPLDPKRPFAVRSVGWRKGRSPRFMQVTRGTDARADSLIPQNPPGQATTAVTCPGPPVPLPAPGILRDDAFGAPSLDTWGLSVRFAAEAALLRMFGASNASQHVDFAIEQICEDTQGAAEDDGRRDLLIHVALTVRLGAQTNLQGTTVFRFDLSDLSIRIDKDARLALEVETEEKTPAWAQALKLGKKADNYFYSKDLELPGMKLTALAEAKTAEGLRPTTLPALALEFAGGRFLLKAPEEIDLLLRIELSDEPLVFRVSAFALGPGGLDLEAALLSDALKLAGLSAPFALTTARMRIAGSRLDLLEVQGVGTLPAILDFAPVKVGVVLGQDAEGQVVLKTLKAELGDRGKPIMSRGTRFRFEIEELDLIYQKDDKQKDGKAWFEITGSAQFRPDPGEFGDGLLSRLKTVTLEFTRLRVGDDLLDNVALMVELNRPVRFSLFGLFEMEIRSIGLQPKFPDFAEPAAAILIGGQIRFAEAGDVVQAQIDFHRLAIGLPRSGSALPQVHAKGLKVVISSSEGFKIGGRVESVDDGTLKGFRGEGVVQVPGLPELSAAFAFMRVRGPDGIQRKAWFVAIEAAKISYLVGGALPIYLRQVGLGFGYRYTLPLVEEFSKKGDPAKLIAAMLEALEQHQSLASVDSWVVDADDIGRKWTIALEAVLSLGTTQPTPFDYDAKAEKRMRTVFAQFLAAYRSDFTLVAAAKLWFPVSVDDFFENREGMRARPLATGFIAYSAPQRRLLAHARKADNPYLGPSDEAPFPMVLKAALDAVDYDVTLLVEPGLVHAELGWPDRLRFVLKVGPLSVECRGGILMRLQDDLLIYGYYFSAHGQLSLSAGVDAGVVGLQIEAQVSVTYATRLLIGADTRKPLDSHVYGAIGLDLSVRFSVRAWLRIKLKFVRITIRISFSFSLQLTVLGEVGWAGQGELGFRGRATLSISVFGRSLGIKVDVGVNKGGVDKARSVLAKYATSILEPGKAPVFPGLAERAVARGSGIDAKVVGPPSGESGSDGGTEGHLALASAKSAATAAVSDDDRFVLALRRGATVAVVEAGGTVEHVLHFVWIMPGPSGTAFYPPPSDTQAEVRYAELRDLAPVDGVELFVHRAAEWTAWPDWTLVKLDARPQRAIEIDESVDGDPNRVQLNLARMVAGGHVPTWSGNPTEEQGAVDDFPANWPMPGLGVTLPAPPSAWTERQRDARVFDAASAARTMRRTLDPADPWDGLLLKAVGQETPSATALSEAEQAAAERQAAALANQAILLQGFHDDLCRIAALTRWSGAVPVTDGFDPGRPSVLDLGMLLCLRVKAGATLPDWVTDRNAANPPVVTYFDHAGAQTSAILRPAVSADLVNFAANPPAVVRGASVFDDEHLAIAWEMDWGARSPRQTGQNDLPRGDFATGAREDVEGHIESYDIQVVDARNGTLLATDRVSHADTLVEVTTRTESTQGGGAKSELVPLAPRFGFSVPTSTLRPRALGEGAVGSVFVTIVPNGHSGTSGEPFSFVVDYTSVRAPLAATDATARLSYRPAGGGKAGFWALTIGWSIPKLPADSLAVPPQGWRLILRPLAEVPLGAYPEAAGDPTDRGRMGATAYEIQDGDIQVAFNLKGTSTGLEILPASPAATGLYDRRGKRLADDDPARAAAEGFLKGVSAAVSGGRAWRLFLMAGPLPKPGEKPDWLPEGPVSGLTAVTLLLDHPGQPARPLPHFEWPDPLPVPLHGSFRDVAPHDLVVQAGAVSLPIVKSDGGSGVVLEFPEFKPGEKSRRAFEVTWNLLPSQPWKENDKAPTGSDLEPAAIAACAVYEWRLDDLVNADLQAGSGDGYRLLQRIVPVEAARAREIPMSMHETALWEAQYQVATGSSGRASTGKPPPPLVWPAWADPAGLPEAERLAAERGLALACRPIHAALARFLGLLAERTSPLRLELVDGPPPLARLGEDWMASTAEAVDPYGWAALSDLGLSVQIAARDPVTGVLVDQGVLVKAVSDEVAAAGWHAGSEDAAYRHLAVVLPVQHAQAYRARPGEAAPKDIGVGLVQLSLRPIRDPAVAEAEAAALPDAWVGLVARALARAEPGAPDLAAALAADRERQQELLRAIPRARYADWAARFTGVAPESLADRFTAAQLRTSAPLLLAADGAGTLRMTRLIDEEWATRRRFAVRREGRYDRMLEALELLKGPVDPDRSMAGGDGALPRVRAIAAPTVLHLGLWVGAGGRPFHDVVVTHAEDALQDRNWSVRGRLEFGDIARHYDRMFDEKVFVGNLGGLLNGAQLSRAVTAQVPPAGTTAIEGDGLEDTLLGVVPAARWGGRRYRDAAEPFYYLQRVTLMASAGDDVQAMTEPLVLPQQEAGPLVALPGEPAVVWTLQDALAFPSPQVPGLDWATGDDEARRARAEDWWPRVPKALRSWFRSDSARIEIRLPRYAESLAASLRETVFRHETEVRVVNGVRHAPAGLLPDAQARVLVTRRDAASATAEALMQITPNRNTHGEAFRVEAVSSSVALEDATVSARAGKTWTDGLWAAGDLRTLHPEAFVRTDLTDLTEIKAIDATALPDEVGPETLSIMTGLICLAPLALRLVARPADGGDSWVGLLSPPAAPPLGLLRPHLWTGSGTPDPAPGQVADMAVALRLLLDPASRTLFARAARQAAPVTLLREIEEAAVCWATRPGLWTTGLVTEASVLEWAQDGGLRMWAKGGEGWRSITGAPAEVLPGLQADTPVIVLVWRLAATATEPGWTADKLQGLLTGGAVPAADGGVDIARGVKVTVLAERIARGAFRPGVLARPEVDVLRGNLAPQPWGREGPR